MKSSRKITTALYLTAACLTIFASPTAYAKGDGSKGGGGGNTRGSSRGEVHAIIGRLTQEPGNYLADQYNIFSAFWNLSLYRGQHPDPANVGSALDRMLGSRGTVHFGDTPVYADLQDTHYEVLNHGKCNPIGPRKHTAASTRLVRNAPICISVEELMAIPADALAAQARALIAHEITHHFGFGERAANAMQEFMLNQGIGIVDTDTTLGRVNIPLQDLEIKLRQLVDQLEIQAPISSSSICVMLGQITTIADSMYDGVKTGLERSREGAPQSIEYADLVEPARQIYMGAGLFKGFCMSAYDYQFERVPPTVSAVPVDDRSVLLSSASALLEKARTLGKKTGAQFYSYY